MVVSYSNCFCRAYVDNFTRSTLIILLDARIESLGRTCARWKGIGPGFFFKRMKRDAVYDVCSKMRIRAIISCVIKNTKIISHVDHVTDYFIL